MDLETLKNLAGITTSPNEPSIGENISHTASEKAAYMRKHNIEPGTDEWFKLWYAKPRLTGENPMPKNK